MTADMPDPVEVAHYRPCGGCGAASPDQRCIGCFHEFGGARAMQDAMAGREVRDARWMALDEAPKDGSFVRLLVQPDPESFTSFEDSAEPYTTIGFNSLADTGEDRWQFVGWDWSHDCFTDGHGEVLNWAPFSPALEPAGAQEGGYDPERDLDPCLEARLFVTPESLDAFMEANPLPPEPTPAPDVPGLVERARNAERNITGRLRDAGWQPTRAGIESARNHIRYLADALEALQAEVARLTEEANGEFVAAAVRVMRGYPGFDARDYEFDGISADDFEQFFSEDMREAWRCAEAAETRATAAEAERDALRAEVERLRVIVERFYQANDEGKLCDEIDNDGSHYPSQFLDDTLNMAAAALAPAKAGG